MRFHFDDRKTAHAAAFLLSRAGGRMAHMQLIKLLYLADREMLLKHGMPITGDQMTAMRHGPVLSRVLDFITDGPTKSASAWFDYVGPSIDYVVALKPEAKTDPEQLDELSRFELRLLGDVFEKYGRMDRWDLVELLHKMLPEWSDPGSSAFKISPEQILRAESRSDEEIQRVKEDADELWLLGPSNQ